MARRLLPAVLVLSALSSDLAGNHGLSLFFLLVAIPAGFILALDCYGDVLEARCGGIRPILAGLSVVLLVFSAAVRSPAVVGGVPQVAVSSLVLILVLYAAIAVGALLPAWRAATESA